MSKVVEVEVGCGLCGRSYKAALHRSIWGEHAENRALVFSDRINVISCPRCRVPSRAPYALMYVDLDKHFVVWYEPLPDAMIDTELPHYAAMYGADCCYVTAPRIADWAEFKATIERFERGELRAKPPGKLDARAARAMVDAHRSRKAGCLTCIAVAGLGIGLLGIAASRLVT